MTRGFHAHAYEPFPGWPEGISDNEGIAVATYPEHLEAVVADGMAYRMTRMTAPGGTSLPLDDAALFTLADVYEGVVQRTADGGDGTPPFWNPIHGGYLPAGSGFHGVIYEGPAPAVYDMSAATDE